MNEKRPFQFSLRWALGVVTLIAIALALWPVVSRKRESRTEGKWTYFTSVSRFASGSDDRISSLTWNDAPLPASLVEHQVTLITPLGDFVPREDAQWEPRGLFDGYPRHWLNPTWPEFDLQATLAQGYYDTSQLELWPGNRSPWRTTRLTGTPEHWVYAYKLTPTGHIGYWADPAKLGELEWER